MELKKNHYIQIGVCVLLSLICVVLYVWYYREYIAPESYTIGTVSQYDYVQLEIKDYISEDDVIFSQNINDTSFKVENGTATYEYVFDAKEFNGLINNYSLFVNDTLIDTNQNAGTISGVYTINYIDVNNQIFNTTNININFTFQSLSSTLRVTFSDTNDNLGLLMNYFKNNNFIITLSANPFSVGQVQTDDEFGRINCNVNVAGETNVYVEYDGALYTNNSILVARSGELTVFTVISNDITNLTVDTDGEYSIDYDETNYEYKISWTNANYLNININADSALIS